MPNRVTTCYIGYCILTLFHVNVLSFWLFWGLVSDTGNSTFQWYSLSELILGACIFDFQVTAHNIKGNKTKDASWPAFKGEPNERLKLALKGRNVNIFSAAGCCSIKHLYKTFFCLFGIWAPQCTAMFICSWTTKNPKGLHLILSLNMPALFFMSVTQTAGHKMAAPTVMFLWLTIVDYWPTGWETVCI